MGKSYEMVTCADGFSVSIQAGRSTTANQEQIPPAHTKVWNLAFPTDLVYLSRTTRKIPEI